MTAETCRWFALCANPAIGKVAHPYIGEVPVCRRCADKMGLTVIPQWRIEARARAAAEGRTCPGGPEWECEEPAHPGDRYCLACRDQIERDDALDRSLGKA